MNSNLSFKEIEKLATERTESKIYCKHCGHGVLIPKKKTKVICSWCGNYVFENAREEFKYRINELRRK